jgi:hypothetical protein
MHAIWKAVLSNWDLASKLISKLVFLSRNATIST